MSRPAGEVLRLLSMCPDMPVEVLSVQRRGRHSVSTEQLLRRVESSNFVHKRLVALPPLLGSRRLALWWQLLKASTPLWKPASSAYRKDPSFHGQDGVRIRAR